MLRILCAILAATAFVVVCAVLLGIGCFTPPAVMQGVQIDDEIAIELYPPGTERVQVDGPAGNRLRGLFVPAAPDAPVVLHLLESSGSVASLKFHYYLLGEQLADLGFASLFLDYSGVGASSGERSPRNLAGDALSMWEEAVRRAGGRPERVVLRGISIGTVAVSELLDHGARPAAVVLLAPVCAGEEDFFLSTTEREMLGEAVRVSGGRWSSRPCGHALFSAEAHALLAEEIPLLSRLFPDVPDSDVRLARLKENLSPEILSSVEETRLREAARYALDADPELVAAGIGIMSMMTDPYRGVGVAVSEEETVIYLRLLSETNAVLP